MRSEQPDLRHQGDAPANKTSAPKDLQRFFGEFHTGVPRSQLVRLAEQTPVNTCITIVTVVLTVSLLYPHIPSRWAFPWAAIQIGLLALVIYRWQRTQRKFHGTNRLDMRPTRSGLMHAVAWAALSGSTWGGLIAFLPSLPPLQELATIMIIGGMVAGASSTLAAVPQVAMTFILTCTAPVAYYFAFAGDSVRSTLAMMTVVFAAAMLATTRVVYLSLIRQLEAENLSETFRAAHLQQTIASITNMESDVQKSLGTCLDEICAYLNWPLGHLYLLEEDGSGSLRSPNIWHMDDVEHFEDFRQLSAKATVRPGCGLAGGAVESCAPIWLEDLDGLADFGRRYQARQAGIKSGFAFPVLVKNQVVAVLEFFSTELSAPDTRMLEKMAPVGIQIGRAIERHRAGEALKKSELRLRALVDISVQGIVVHQAGTPLFVNEECARIYGYSKDELLNLGSIFELVHVDDRERLGDYTRARSVGTFAPDTYEYTGVHKDGRDIPLLTRSAVIEWDNKPAVIATLFDLSDLKQAESDLLQSEQALRVRVDKLEAAEIELKSQEHDLRTLNDDLVSARDRAEAANRAKSAFLTSMSHELRTPLNAVIGFSELLKNETFGPIGNTRYKEYASLIQASGAHLLALVNEVLDLAVIESGKEKLNETEIDVAQVAKSALDSVTPQASENGILLSLNLKDDLPLLYADKRKLKQILLNLLSNAVKFNVPGGSVSLTAHVDVEGFVLSVADKGIGIAEEDIPKALRGFEQIDGNLNRKYEGAGIGLTITAALVDLHRGNIGIESEIGQGTTVTVRFPASRVGRQERLPEAMSDDIEDAARRAIR